MLKEFWNSIYWESSAELFVLMVLTKSSMRLFLKLRMVDTKNVTSSFNVQKNTLFFIRNLKQCKLPEIIGRLFSKNVLVNIFIRPHKFYTNLSSPISTSVLIKSLFDKGAETVRTLNLNGLKNIGNSCHMNSFI